MNERQTRAVEAYQTGLTLAEIGIILGVTRERARQILKKVGYTGKNGGQVVRRARRAAEHAAVTARLAAVMDETGCSAPEAARRLGVAVTDGAKAHAHTTRKARAVVRFWSRVDKSGGPDACWPWTGPRFPAGYGSAGNVVRGERFAHRVAFILANDRKPQAAVLFRGAACVLHSCDNPPCCNPAHLREGTMADTCGTAIRAGGIVLACAVVTTLTRRCPRCDARTVATPKLAAVLLDGGTR